MAGTPILKLAKVKRLLVKNMSNLPTDSTKKLGHIADLSKIFSLNFKTF